MTAELASSIELARRALAVMADGEIADFAAVIHPAATNREAIDEPPETRGTGPEALLATAHWLRSAYADLNWEVHDQVADRDLVVLHATMSGRQVGPFVTYDADGRVAQVMPPTGRTFAVKQTHWFRLADGLVIEHWANRDDLGQARQLGWVPPTLAYVFRMARAKRRAVRAQAVRPA